MALTRTYHRLIIAGLIVTAITVSLMQVMLFETLDIASLLDTDSIFLYANILLSALIPVVLISLGFALARFIVAFVQRVFNQL